MRFGMLQRLFRHEAASGVVLMLASALALVLANSPTAEFYDLLLSLRGSVRIGSFGIEKPLLLWVNDGLMAIFFLLVGLEIKREVLGGQLSDRSRAILPAAAAIGGMIVPALIYLGITWHGRHIGAASGWAIPAATDIAFSLGVMALLGNRVPNSLKLFLTALAIIDDLGAIVVIAIFYTEELSWVSLEVAAAALAILVLHEPRRGSADCLVRARRPGALGVRAQIRRARHLGRRSVGPGDPVRDQAWRRIPADPPRT